MSGACVGVTLPANNTTERSTHTQKAKSALPFPSPREKTATHLLCGGALAGVGGDHGEEEVANAWVALAHGPVRRQVGLLQVAQHHRPFHARAKDGVAHLEQHDA